LNPWIRLSTGCAVLAMAACAAIVRPGNAELAAGVRLYETGRLDDAARFLQRSIDLGLDESDQVTAHKYLAFIHCAQGLEARCGDEFRLALAIRPSFDLDKAEAGHPTWGRVFRTVKAGRR